MRPVFTPQDEQFMKIALDEAQQSFAKGKFPCGAVLAVNNKIVGKSENKK